MKDLLGLMGKAKEMQAKFQAMQEEIAALEATGQPAAHNDAKAKVEAIMQEKTKALTSGLPIPPGMKLPF